MCSLYKSWNNVNGKHCDGLFICVLSWMTESNENKMLAKTSYGVLICNCPAFCQNLAEIYNCYLRLRRLLHT